MNISGRITDKAILSMPELVEKCWPIQEVRVSSHFRDLFSSWAQGSGSQVSTLALDSFGENN
jgi:hypothetical protein